jgi:hypothetical protein
MSCNDACKDHLHNVIARPVQHFLLGHYDCEMKFLHQKRSKPHDKVDSLCDMSL